MRLANVPSSCPSSSAARLWGASNRRATPPARRESTSKPTSRSPAMGPRIAQSFDGDNAGAETASHLLAVAAYLVQNPLERVKIESIDVDISQVKEPRAATLTDAHADRTVVRRASG